MDTPESPAPPAASSGVDSRIASWYLLDGQDRVVDVCAEWDAVAQQGQATASCRRHSVIGQPLRNFISGDTSQMFIDAALQATRLTAQTRVLRYRCDTPTLWRELEMHLIPLPQGGVRVEHHLLSQRSRTRPVHFETALRFFPNRGGLVRCCSQCLSVQIGEQAWQAPETLALAQYQVSYTVCPRCHLKALEPLQGLPSAQQRPSTP